MYQSMVEGRYVPRTLLTKDFPADKHNDNAYLVDALDWDANVNPSFKDSHYLEPLPVADTARAGYVDRWVVYGQVNGEELFSARELTVDPGAKVTVQDAGAYGLIAGQGCGTLGGKRIQTPAMIRFGALAEDENLVNYDAAPGDVNYVNQGAEPLVT